MASVLDTFAYVFKPVDEGVEKKVDDITKKSQGLKKANEGVADSFKEFASEAKNSLSEIVPGADKLIDVLGKVSKAFRGARSSASGEKKPGSGVGTAGSRPTTAARNSGGGSAPPPITNTAAEGGAEDGALGGLGMAAGAAAVAFTLATVAVGILTKAFIEGAAELTESRKKAQDAGVNSTQQAAWEQYSKSMKQSKQDATNVLKNIADKTREGWVTAHTFGNIFGLGNETTQLLKHHGIAFQGKGGLRNPSAILDDISKKMAKMPRDAAIGFGQFFGMTKDFATALRDNKQSMDQFALANQKAIQQQAAAIDNARSYERAQQALSNAWDDFKIKIGGKVLPVLTTLLDDIIDAADQLDDLGDALKGFWDTCKEIMSGIGDWIDKHAGKGATSGLVTSELASQAAPLLVAKAMWDKVFDHFKAKGQTDEHNEVVEAKQTQLATGGKKVSRAEAEKQLLDDQAKDRAEYLRKANQQVSDNSNAAKTQLEAANLMKVATARFGLSVEQYMAMWAASSGKNSGLASNGGVTAEQFGGIYKNVVSKYATSEVAQAMYGRGAPMMAQLPQQYAMGFGVTPLGVPRNAIGLSKAADAVQNTNYQLPSGNSTNQKPTQTIDVKTGPITINTQSSDPQAINSALSDHLGDQMKYALNKLNDGQVA